MTASTRSMRALGGPLDLGVAALSAVSVAFLAFAMPDALFASLVSASRLPELIAAAAPPLGMTARYAVMAAGGALAFLLVWSLLRALDGSAAEAPAAEADPDAPRLRRADTHPDAPARRPIFAGADFGEPAGDIFELDSPAPLSVGLQEPAEPEWTAPAREREFQAEPDAGQPEPSPASAARLPRFMVPEAPEPVAERNPVLSAAQKKPFDLDRLPQGSAPAADSIGSLMGRLERGLAEREEIPPAAAADPEIPAALAAAAIDPEASLPPEGVRHRLRSAISELNQRASRG